MNVQSVNNGLTLGTDDLEGVSALKAPGFIQQINRAEQDGFDTLAGYFRCKFEPGQQRYTLHVMIQPAMPSVPEVETMALDLEQVRIRLTDCKVYGLRAEIVLSQPATQATSVLVEVIAASPLTVDRS